VVRPALDICHYIPDDIILLMTISMWLPFLFYAALWLSVSAISAWLLFLIIRAAIRAA
jgi:hypothetical protein